MRTQVAKLLVEMIDHLNRTGSDTLEIRKQSQLDQQTDTEIEEYVADIKKLFLEQFKRDPDLKKINPEKIWQSMENFVRKDVNKLLEKKAKLVLATK
jgi:ribulose kinase